MDYRKGIFQEGGMKCCIFIVLFCFILLYPVQSSYAANTVNSDEQAYIGKGDGFFSKDMLKEAVMEYNKALAINPGNAYVNKKLGISYLKLGDFNLAFIPLAKALKADPVDAEAMVNLGIVYTKNNNIPKSISLYEKAVSIEPQNVGYRYKLAEALTWQEQYDEAIQQDNKIIEISTDEKNKNEMRILISQIYERKAKKEKNDDYYNDALRELREVLKKDPNNVKALNEAGGIYLETKKVTYARDVLEKAYKLDFNNYDVQMRLAQVYSWVREYDKAISIYTRVLNQNPQDVGALYRLGEVYSWQKEYEKSINCYDKILKKDHENTGALIGKARVYALQKKYPDADRIFQTILQKEPDNIGALMAKAEIKTWQKEYETSIDCYDLILKKDPQNTDAMVGKARVYALKGDYTNSERLFDYVLSQEPDNPWALMNRAETETWQWEWTSAANDYKKVLKHDSANISASDALKDIDFITSPSIEGVIGVFEDSDKFKRRWTGGTFSLKPFDKTQIEIDYLKWIFQQGDNAEKFYRDDGTVKIKQHISSFLDVEAGYMFNRYTNEAGDNGIDYNGNAWMSSATITIRDTANVYLSYDNSIPVSDSILTVQDHFSADIAGVGLNFLYLDPVSIQGGYTSSKYSDDNKKTTSEVQLSLRAIDDPNITFRGKYTTLNFDKETDVYWSPQDYRTSYFIISAEKTFWRRSSIGIEGTEAYFFQDKKGGSGASGFINLVIHDTLCINVYGSYFNAKTKDPWTGNAGGAKIKIVF